MSAAAAAIQTRDDDSQAAVECRLVSACTSWLDELAAVGELIRPSDIADPRARIVFEAIGRDADRIRDLDGAADFVLLARCLDERGDLDAIGGAAGLSDFQSLEAVSSSTLRLAREVRAASLERTIRREAIRISQDPDDHGAHDRLGAARDSLRALRAGESKSNLNAILKSGDALRALTDREPLPPVYPGIPPRGHLTLRIGASFAGKTTAEVYNAMARAAGVASWEGAPAFEPGRTLIVAPDEPVEQIARQIKRLAWNHPGGRLFDYFSRISVIGLDVTVPMDALSGLRFHDEGFRLLDDLLTREGFDSLVIDAYADLLPTGESEQENETASRIGGDLEALAVKHGIPITLIHHVGKTGGRSTAEIDVRDLGRGASALAAKARCIHTFEEVEGFPNQRRIRTRTNLTRSPAPLDLIVSDRGTGGSSIDFFRPVDPASTYPIADVMPEVSDEWISTSELARRLSGQTDGKPGGHSVELAKTVRSIWLGAELVEIRKGANRATECRRIR